MPVLRLAPLLAALTLHPASAATLPKAAPAPPPSAETLDVAPFGAVHLLVPKGEPRHVVLFVSGDGGWNARAAAMAKSLAGTDTLLAGVDIESYRERSSAGKGACVNAAADFEALSKLVQKRRALPRYQPPVLAGYSAGASLAYAALAEAPPHTFLGAVSLGFCPSLEFPKPLCKGSGFRSEAAKEVPRKGRPTDWIFAPATHLEQDWVAFTGDQDSVCSPEGIRDFLRQVPRGVYLELPGTGHAYGNAALWTSPYRLALARLEGDAALASPRPSAPAVADLPLVEVPAAPGKGPAIRTFAVMLSGDGGWAGLDREVAGALAAKGIPVVGWSSLDYFWQPRTPEKGARDLERVLRHYLSAWGRDRVILAGYSLGADVLPFFAGRLPPDLLARVDLVALLGPSRETAFEFHLSDWLGGRSGPQLPVLPELRKLAGRPLLCLYGDEEDDSLCPLVHPPAGHSVAFHGAHHFGGGYQAVADRLLAALPAAPRALAPPTRQP
jgi:type IV secretory pathway VirJ component